MVRIFQYVFFICISLLSLSACDLLKYPNSDFVIKVSGSPGLVFSGHYSIVEYNELPDPINVRGFAPGEYKGDGAMAFCYFRKLVKKGSLKAEIFKDGKLLSQSGTDAPFGFVSLKTPIPEKKTIVDNIRRHFLNKQETKL